MARVEGETATGQPTKTEYSTIKSIYKEAFHSKIYIVYKKSTERYRARCGVEFRYYENSKMYKGVQRFENENENEFINIIIY